MNPSVHATKQMMRQALRDKGCTRKLNTIQMSLSAVMIERSITEALKDKNKVQKIIHRQILNMPEISLSGALPVVAKELKGFDWSVA